MRSRSASSALVAVLAAALPVANGSAPTAFRLLPAGSFRAADGSGRPANVAAWRLDQAAAKKLIAAAQARASDYVIDYEHQTLSAAANGQPAPAAGWFRALEWRADGLWAVDVRWTDRAAAMIAGGEYRYISPVFAYDDQGVVVAIAHAGLVNSPGLDGLTDLSALSASLFPPTHQESQMKLILAALALAATATEDDAVAAIAALKSSHQTELAALKSAAPDASQYVPIATVTALRAELTAAGSELAALKAAAAAAEVDGVVKAALADGKLTPAMEPWARDLGKTNIEALKGFVAAAPAGVKPGATQSGGKAPEGGGASLDEQQLAVCKALGVKPEDYIAAKAA